MNIGPEAINNYIGPSMNPTFKPGDGLEILPDKMAACGDVISFRPKNKGIHIVHRVVRVENGGVRTRGDNNKSIDPWLLTPEEISGRVVSIKRDGKTISVAGGARGRCYGVFIRQYNMMFKRLTRILHPFYRLFSGAFRIFFPLLSARFILFKRSKGIEYQLIMGRLILARKAPGAQQWRIRRPFRLFINEKDLDRGIYADNR